MPTITRIVTNKRRANRRTIYLDGEFAFACGVNVVARFRLREGMTVTGDQLREIEQGELKQNCTDRAMLLLERRLHSRAELQRKLRRAEFSESLIEQVLDALTRLGCVDDERYAQVRVTLAAERKQHGRRRALRDLLQRGVDKTVALRRVAEIYGAGVEPALARELAEKHAPRLRRLDAVVARRRLTGLLARRGFGHEHVNDVVNSVLGRQSEPDTFLADTPWP